MDKTERREIEESSVALGDIVTKLSAARDAAMAGERIQMDAWIGGAEKVIQWFARDCRIVCEMREDEQCSA